MARSTPTRPLSGPDGAPHDLAPAVYPDWPPSVGERGAYEAAALGPSAGSWQVPAAPSLSAPRWAQAGEMVLAVGHGGLALLIGLMWLMMLPFAFDEGRMPAPVVLLIMLVVLAILAGPLLLLAWGLWHGRRWGAWGAVALHLLIIAGLAQGLPDGRIPAILIAPSIAVLGTIGAAKLATMRRWF